jgi:alkylation response protein AidB-like acyl-CoA dehydrogenase
MSQRAFGKTIDKFQALRHTIVEHATEVEHCKVFNYAAVARLDKGEYVVKEATMAKLKSTKVADEAIYSCLQMLEVMDIWKNILSSFVETVVWGQ